MAYTKVRPDGSASATGAGAYESVLSSKTIRFQKLEAQHRLPANKRLGSVFCTAPFCASSLH